MLKIKLNKTIWILFWNNILMGTVNWPNYVMEYHNTKLTLIILKLYQQYLLSKTQLTLPLSYTKASFYRHTIVLMSYHATRNKILLEREN